MPQTMRDAVLSDPVRSLDRVRPQMAKAVRPSDRALCAVVAAAVVKHYGSVKAAAISLSEPGKELDPSLMMRELKEGKFARLDAKADSETKAFIAEELKKAFPAQDPKAQAQRLIRETRAKLDELAEVVA